MNKVLEDKIVHDATKFWYLIVILVMLIGCIILWQSKENAKQDLQTVKSQLKLQEEIEQTEARLEAVRKREEEYQKLLQVNEELNKSLSNLDKIQKEIRTKRSNYENEIKKMDSKSLSSSFDSFGYPNSIKSR